MLRILRMRRWPPYITGALIGVLCWFAFLAADTPIGVSSALVKTAAMAGQAVVPAHVAANPYYARFRPQVDWEWMLVAGLALGAFVSSRLSKDAREDVPALWRTRFGPGAARRYAAAFLGGALLLFGARLAGGCTSGHGISGSLQLAVSGWTFFLTLFASGAATAWLLYRKEVGRG